MWYEVLPSVLLIGGLITFGNLTYPITHYLSWGKPASRYLRDPIDYQHYRRDCKLDPTLQGNGLINRYFEDVPDLPDSEKKN